jgi:hypothetical protein
VLLELVDKGQNEQKLTPEINPSASQEMDSIDDDSLRGERSWCRYRELHGQEMSQFSIFFD